MDSVETATMEAPVSTAPGIDAPASSEPVIYVPRPLPPPSTKGKAFMAMGGAMIWPGIGHFIVGRFNRGLFWFTLAIGVLLGGVYVLQNPHWLQVMIVLIPLGIIISLAQLFDAARCGRLSPFGLLREPALRFLVGGILAVLAVAFHHSALTFLQDNVYELCYTPTPSMSPSVSPGDSYLTLKGLPIHRWDIVGLTAPPGVYQAEELAIMKRVVGIPGEKVEITPKGLFINDKPVALPPDVGPYYAVDLWDRRLTHADKTIAGNGCWGRPIYLGPDEYYLLGDNSAESGDARMWPSIKGRQPGAITGNEITCTIVAICWPPERWRLFPE